MWVYALQLVHLPGDNHGDDLHQPARGDAGILLEGWCVVLVRFYLSDIFFNNFTDSFLPTPPAPSSSAPSPPWQRYPRCTRSARS